MLFFYKLREYFAQGKYPQSGESKTDYSARINQEVQTILDTETAPFLIVAHGGVFHTILKNLNAQTNIKHLANCKLTLFEYSYDMWRAYYYGEES